MSNLLGTETTTLINLKHNEALDLNPHLLQHSNTRQYKTEKITFKAFCGLLLGKVMLCNQIHIGVHERRLMFKGSMQLNFN